MDEGCWCCLCYEEQIVRRYWWDRALPWKCCGWKSFTVAYRVEGALWKRRAVDLCKGMQSTAEHSCQLIDEGSDCSWCLQNDVSTMFELCPQSQPSIPILWNRKVDGMVRCLSRVCNVWLYCKAVGYNLELSGYFMSNDEWDTIGHVSIINVNWSSSNQCLGFLTM